MAPVVHGLEAEYAGQVEFIYLDIDDPATGDFKRDLGYNYQPHIVLLDAEGNVVEQFIGYTQEAALRAGLQQLSQ